MKKWNIRMLLAVLALVLILVPVRAADDPVDQVGKAMLAFQEQVNVPVRDYDALMQAVLERYPVLIYYYSGSKYVSQADGLSITFYYKNQEISQQEIMVVTSYDQVLGALGLAMCDGKDVIRMVMPATYYATLPADDTWHDFDRAWHQLEQDYYMAYMGYHKYYGNNSYINVGTDYTVGTLTVDISLWDDLSKDQMFLWRSEVEAWVTEFCMTQVAQDMPDGMKELIIHDFLVNNNAYDLLETMPEHPYLAKNHTPYGAFTGSTVCQGYTAAAHLLFRAVGIRDYMVSGDAGGPHIWNEVLVDGNWYLLDVTFDDPIVSDGSQILSYDYFNLDDAAFYQDHTASDESYPDSYPACISNDRGYDYCKALLDGGTSSYTNFSADKVETLVEDRLALYYLYYGKNPDPNPTSDPAPDPNPDTSVNPTPNPDSTQNPTPQPDLNGILPNPNGQTNGTTNPSPDLRPVLDLLGVTNPTPNPNQITNPSQNPTKQNGMSLWSLLVLLLLAVLVGWFVVKVITDRRVAEARAEREEDRASRLHAYQAGTAYRRRF